MDVTNKAPGLQGVHTSTGVVYLKPGQTRDLTFGEGQEKRARRLPFLTFGGAPKAAAEPREPKHVESVAGGEGVELTEAEKAKAAADLLEQADKLHFQTWKKAAGELLGPDNLPDTKDEILAALKAKAEA
ncbi:hypothetical protein ABLE91_05765 [Aquabacter sp. CN5-332]|uniref:hypothetical protein n=1 Tax=Aquabacter sp. CN5-332 TaxID=3156608 RepID=UPI0032B4E894